MTDNSTTTPWLIYANQGATRNRPLTPQLVDAMSFLGDMGVTMEVFSGGQPGKGEKGARVGSVRHDHGGAADVFFYKDGKRLDWANPADLPVFEDIVKKGKANGVTGFGAGDGYMQPGSMHLGFGTPGVWGAGGKGANAPAWLRNAFDGTSSPKPEDAPLYTTVTAKEGGAVSYTAGTEAPVYADKQELKPDEEAPTLWQLQKDAYNQEQTFPWLADKFAEPFPADPTWKGYDEATLKTALQERNLPAEQYAAWFTGANSQADFDDRLAKAQQNHERQLRLSQAGLTGTLLQIGNSMLDPVALAADVAAGSVAPQYVFGRRAGRVNRILQGALVGAAGGAAAEGVNYAVNPNRDAMDVLMGTVFGFGVGGAVGKLHARAETVNEGIALQRLAQRQIDEFEGIAQAHSGSTVGAAHAGRQKPFLDEEGLGAVMDEDIADSYAKGWRFDLAAMLDKSSNPVTRLIGSALVQDGTGKAGGRINAIAASEEVTRFHEEWVTGARRTYNPQLDIYLRERGATLWDRGKIEKEFNEQISAYIRDRKPLRGERYSQPVRLVGDKIAQLQADILDMAKNPFIREGLSADAVKGMEMVAKDPHYIMRRWDADKVILAGREYVDGTIDRLIFGAMRSANPDIGEDILKAAAKGFTRAIEKRSHGIADALGRPLGAENFDTLKRALVDEGGMDEGNAEALLKTFTKQPDAGRDARAKQRVLLDEGYRLPDMPIRKDGTADERGLSITDLLDNDALGLFTDYSRRMAGLIALARVRIKDPGTGEIIVNGIKSDADFNTLLKVTDQKAADAIREGRMTQKQAEADRKRLTFAHDYIRGRPSEAEGTNFGWWARAVRKFNFTRILNQVGFAQIPEAGMIVGTLGTKAAFSQLPAFRRILSQDGETILKSGLADDVEKIWGLGGERLRATSEYRYDDLTGSLDEAKGGWRDKAEKYLNIGNRITSEASGMTQANIFLQRWAGMAIIQKFADMAAKGGKGMSAKRLADLGLDAEMSGRIMKMMNAAGNLEHTKGVITGKKVSRLLIDNWTDKEAAQAFVNAGYRLAGQIVQRNDIGNLAMWMSHPAAKMLMQFRTFVTGAYTKQTLKNLNMRDGAALSSMVITSGLAGAVYVMQSKIQAIGRSDREEWLDKRLTWEEIAAAGFSRAGWASILPMLIDTALPIAGVPQQFTYSRTSGQATDMALGNPTTGGIDDAYKAGLSLSRLLREGEWSQQEARAILRVLPFGNALPAVIFANAMISDLPNYGPKEAR